MNKTITGLAVFSTGFLLLYWLITGKRPDDPYIAILMLYVFIKWGLELFD